MDRNSKVLIFSGTVVVAISLAIELLCFSPWTGEKTVALGLILWSEIAFFGGLLLIGKIARGAAQPFFRAGSYTVIALYSALTFVSAIVFMALKLQPVKLLLTFQLVLLALGAVLLATLWAAGKGIQAQNETTLTASRRVECCIDRLRILAQERPQATGAAQIKKIADDLRFLDCSVSVPADDEIETAITELEAQWNGTKETAAADAIPVLCKSLESLIQRRKIQTETVKRGRI